MECIYCDVWTKMLCISCSTTVLLQTTKLSKQERTQASLSVTGRLNTYFKWKEQAGSEQSMLPHAASYVPWVLTLMVDTSIGHSTYSQLCSMGAHLDGGYIDWVLYIQPVMFHGCSPWWWIGRLGTPHTASYVPWVLTLMVDRSIGYSTYSPLRSMGAHLDGGEVNWVLYIQPVMFHGCSPWWWIGRLGTLQWGRNWGSGSSQQVLWMALQWPGP